MCTAWMLTNCMAQNMLELSAETNVDASCVALSAFKLKYELKPLTCTEPCSVADALTR